MAATTSRIGVLDGVRAVSIAPVVIGHAVHLSGWGGPGSSPPARFVSIFLGNSGVGVETFFVLSGYLITKLLLDERARAGNIDIKAFYLRRFFRILPAFYTYLGIAAVVAAVLDLTLHRTDLVAAALFVWNYVPRTEDWLVAHSWSLCVEEQFYLFWPLSLGLLGPERGRRVAWAIVLLSPLVRLATYFGLPAWRGRIHIMGHTRLDAVMFGALLALAWQDPKFRELCDRLFARGAHWVALIVVYVISPLLTEHFKGKYLISLGLTLEGTGIALIIAYLLRAPDSRMGRLLSARPVRQLGLISFSLYLWQQLLMVGITPRPTDMLLRIVAAVTIAQASFTLVEQPMLELRKRISARRAATA